MKKFLFVGFLLLSTASCYPMTEEAPPLFKPPLGSTLSDSSPHSAAVSTDSLGALKQQFVNADHRKACGKAVKNLSVAIAPYEKARTSGSADEAKMLSLVLGVASAEQLCASLLILRRYPPSSKWGSLIWPPKSGQLFPLAKQVVLENGVLKNLSGKPIAQWPPVSGPEMLGEAGKSKT